MVTKSKSMRIPSREKELCKLLRELLQKTSEEKKILNIWKIFPQKGEGSINLSSRNFKKFSSEWWGKKLTPQLEIDILIVLNEEIKLDDSSLKPCLLGIEVKYFKKPSNQNFYEGISQALAYLTIGIDKTCLLHVFNPEYPDDRALLLSKTAETLIKGCRLPINYVACKLLDDGRFEMLSLYSSPYNVTIEELFYYLKQSPQNPLYSDILYKDEILRRRQTLMALLQIPTIP